MTTRLDTAPQAAQWLSERVRGTLRTHSRAVHPGDGFIAWPGQSTDGRRYVSGALASGVAACLVEEQGVEAFDWHDSRVATLTGLKRASGELADIFFGQPSAVLDLVAVTGTNGKTSVSWWTAQALSRLGRRCGVVGTLGVGEPPRVGGQVPERGAGPLGARPMESTGLTTPDPVTLHAALRDFVDGGFSACALEASSIGIVEHRLDAARIQVAVLTNFTQDHLDYHGDMATYWAAKRSLFDWPGLRAAVIDVDDPQGAALADELRDRLPSLWTVSRHGPARLSASDLRYVDGGLAFTVHEGERQAEVRTALIGDYNASNALAVIGALRALDVPLVDAVASAATFTAVPGRLQRVPGREVEAVVDYAHTPDALEKVLQALRPLAAARGGRLWCVFGCGGNRDAGKRPLMAAIAVRGADHVVITSDNPRDEVPSAIVSQVLAGVAGHDEVDVFEDRRDAIAHAIGQAGPGDVVLLAGKGHEDYQEVQGVRHPFSDVHEATAALRRREGLPA
jgi:UDP-N-acetylmuramoyl-L-alanyl-D-glutamate--2,6-diaminopimelate ligase